MTITPTDPARVTPGTRVRVNRTAYWVRGTQPGTVTAGGVTVPATVITLDDHSTYVVPAGVLIDVIGTPAAPR